MTESKKSLLDIDYSRYDFKDPERFVYKIQRGLKRDVIEEISKIKKEPSWMLEFRLASYEQFLKKPMPLWGADLNPIDFDEYIYYMKTTDKAEKSWEEVPEYIKNTFDRLGIPEAERKFLAGVGAQYECLSGDTRVYTKKGLVPIKEVQAGDIVFSYDETKGKLVPAKVRARAYKGIREVFEVKIGTKIIKATINHPFLSLEYKKEQGKIRGRYFRKWKYLSELKPGDLVAVAKKMPETGEIYELKRPKIKTHVIGRNQAKKFPLEITNRYNSLRLTEQTSQDVMWWFRLYMGDGFIHYQLSLNATIIARFLEMKNHKLCMMWGIPTSTIHTFKSGHPYDDTRGITGYGMQLSGDFEALDCSSSARSKRLKKRGTTFREHVNEFLGFMKIESITPAGEEPVYDIEVEGPHNFVAEGIIVHNSEVVYHSIREDLAKRGVIFVDTDTALQRYPELFRAHFGTVVPPADNKFAALNSAVWSGGSFIYVPKGVKVEIPLQAYFRINAKAMGQFERTLIIADEGSSVHYVEGCTAPIYSRDSLHSAVVEVIAKQGAKVRYTTIQNWSKNVYNLVTKRAVAYENATVEWIDGNLGSKVTMKYPCVYLLGRGAKAEILSVAYAGKEQHQDAGAKVIHVAPETTSTITSKSISKNGGRATYRGLLKVHKGATDVKANVRCDALLLDEFSRSDTYPTMEIEEELVSIGHEATVGKISEEQIFYLMSRGLSESEALTAIVLGFIEPFSKELPMEYAIELNRLIQLEMEGAVG